jgi:hypothetical protein
MKTYILTSEKFTGEIEFRYSESGLLAGYDNRAGFTVSQHRWLLQHLPVAADALQGLAGIVGGRITEMKVELTFERFWKQYFAGRPKDNSSRKRAEARWNRMSKSEQAKAYAYIDAYLGKVAYGTQPKHAETFLNSELWNN